MHNTQERVCTAHERLRQYGNEVPSPLPILQATTGATFWQIETEDVRDFNDACRGVELATIDV
jgi:hypothetical protein